MRLVLISIFLSFQIFAFSQITLDKTYTGSAGLSRINDSDFRFYNFDDTNNQCIIYDEQHQQLSAIDINIADEQYMSSITYVSESLFDADDQLELLYTFSEWELIDTTWYLKYTSRIINANGDLLLDIPGAQYNTVTNTTTGSELLSWIYDFSVSSYPIETLVYHLPGTYSDITDNNKDELLLAWPNPCSQQIYLPIDENADGIQIFNEQGQLIDQVQTNESDISFKYQVNNLSSGIYFYQLISKGSKRKMNKFIIQ